MGSKEEVAPTRRGGSTVLTSVDVEVFTVLPIASSSVEVPQ